MAQGGEPLRRSNVAQSLERGLLALAALRDSRHPDLSLGEISQRLGLPKSTVHRLLGTLERNGFVAQDRRTRRYRLGLALLDFAHHAVERLEVRRHALRAMHALALESGESVYLNVLSGGKTVCVDEVVPPRGVTLGSNVGVALPLHVTGAGKCFLAWPGDERPGDERPGDERPAADGQRAGADGADRRLGAELARVRRRGYATNDEETEPGVRYVAAPIFGADGRVVATLSLGAPVLRAPRAALPRLGTATARAAARVSTGLGFTAAAAAPAGRARSAARTTTMEGASAS